MPAISSRQRSFGLPLTNTGRSCRLCGLFVFRIAQLIQEIEEPAGEEETKRHRHYLCGNLLSTSHLAHSCLPHSHTDPMDECWGEHGSHKAADHWNNQNSAIRYGLNSTYVHILINIPSGISFVWKFCSNISISMLLTNWRYSNATAQNQICSSKCQTHCDQKQKYIGAEETAQNGHQLARGQLGAKRLHTGKNGQRQYEGHSSADAMGHC